MLKSVGGPYRRIFTMWDCVEFRGSAIGEVFVLPRHVWKSMGEPERIIVKATVAEEGDGE